MPRLVFAGVQPKQRRKPTTTGDAGHPQLRPQPRVPRGEVLQPRRLMASPSTNSPTPIPIAVNGRNRWHRHRQGQLRQGSVLLFHHPGVCDRDGHRRRQACLSFCRRLSASVAVSMPDIDLLNSFNTLASSGRHRLHLRSLRQRCELPHRRLHLRRRRSDRLPWRCSSHHG